MRSGFFVCCASVLILIVSVSAALAPDCHQGRFIVLSACIFILPLNGITFCHYISADVRYLLYIYQTISTYTLHIYFWSASPPPPVCTITINATEIHLNHLALSSENFSAFIVTYNPLSTLIGGTSSGSSH